MPTDTLAAGILKRATSPAWRLFGPEPMRRSDKKRLWGAPPVPEPSLGLRIDFPRAGELIVSREYSIRVSAATEDPAELSIDGGPWRQCRRAAGFWRFHWSGFEPGRHHLAVRLRLPSGRTSRSERVSFVVAH